MQTYIFAILSIVFCASCSLDPHDELVAPEVFGTLKIDGSAVKGASISIGRASDKSCSQLPAIAITDAYGSFHVLPKTDKRLTRDPIFGDNIGLTFSLCFSTSGGIVYGGDFVVRTWITKSVRIECSYPEMKGSDLTGKTAYCKEAHA